MGFINYHHIILIVQFSCQSHLVERNTLFRITISSPDVSQKKDERLKQIELRSEISVLESKFDTFVSHMKTLFHICFQHQVETDHQISNGVYVLRKEITMILYQSQCRQPIVHHCISCWDMFQGVQKVLNLICKITNAY